jgi:enoyl-CoA hydratase
VFRLLETSDKPIIAAVNGFAFGGGLELVLATDIRLLADSAKLGLTEINLGLFPGGGGTQRLPRQIPLFIANEMMFSGMHIDAQQAVDYGIANRAVAKSELIGETRSLATRIADKSPLVLKLLKRTVREGAEMPLSAGLALERSMISLVFDTEDAQEGCRAFLEKRPPIFRGR